MLVRNLTPGECVTELERTSVGRLAFVHDGLPKVVPMRFSYDGSDLYGFSMIGQKIESMRLMPAVCVEFDERTSLYQWTSVIATGVYEELPDLPEYESARLHAQTVLQRLASWWQPAFAARAHDKAFQPVFFRIRISALSGHQASPEPADSVSLRGGHSESAGVSGIRKLLSGFFHTSQRVGMRTKR